MIIICSTVAPILLLFVRFWHIDLRIWWSYNRNHMAMLGRFLYASFFYCLTYFDSVMQVNNSNNCLLYKKAATPANTKHLYNICTTSAQRLRRWSNIVQMLYKCFVLTGTDVCLSITISTKMTKWLSNFLYRSLPSCWWRHVTWYGQHDVRWGDHTWWARICLQCFLVHDERRGFRLLASPAETQREWKNVHHMVSKTK